MKKNRFFVNINTQLNNRSGLRVFTDGIDFEVNRWGQTKLWSNNDFILNDTYLINGELRGTTKLLDTIHKDDRNRKYLLKFEDLKKAGFTHAFISTGGAPYVFDLRQSKIDYEHFEKQRVDVLTGDFQKPLEKYVVVQNILIFLKDNRYNIDLCEFLADNNFGFYKFPYQTIKFGPPGTGKSHSVIETIKDHSCQEEATRNDANIITTVFHPDYSYGDFTAKLMPVTENDKVTYQIHAGPLAKALAKAFYDPYCMVYLVVEEINRGNTAAIFGDVFQLLDRDDEGQSEYPITIQQLFYKAIEQEYLLLKSENKEQTASDGNDDEPKDNTERQKTEFGENFKNHNLRLPCNLSIIATMNTSDESVFYMDSAFKRRWHFEYIDVDSDSKTYENEEDDKKSKHPLHPQITAEIGDSKCEWDEFRQALNKFIKEHSNSIRRIEDKLIGLWFIKAKNGKISEAEVQNKLMHYLWDNVFAREKKPLLDKINSKKSIVTFGDFVGAYDEFIDKFCPSPASEGESENDEGAVE